MKDTFVPSKKFINKKWYLIDATNQTLGKLATKISKILNGKEKIIYMPFLETGDCIVVINVEKICISGKKENQKIYRNHSGRPGGMKTEIFSKLQQRQPKKIIERAVKGMLPKKTLGQKIYKNLKIYAGNQHPHRAQIPILLKLES